MGCANPRASVRHCIGAPDEVVSAIQQKITPAGSLRNGKTVKEGAGYTFVSAELHAEGDPEHKPGAILTWATRDPAGSDFVSVDVHARNDSSWPHATFDVREPGAIESRACTELNRGKTQAQIACEQNRGSGDAIQVGKGKNCSDL